MPTSTAYSRSAASSAGASDSEIALRISTIRVLELALRDVDRMIPSCHFAPSTMSAKLACMAWAVKHLRERTA